MGCQSGSLYLKPYLCTVFIAYAWELQENNHEKQWKGQEGALQHKTEEKNSLTSPSHSSNYQD